MRAAIADARRLVVKVGSSSIASVAGGVDERSLDALVDVVAARRARGGEVLLVSSGAIAAGLAPLRLLRRPRDLATLQAAASVGQGLLVAGYSRSFARHDMVVGQVLLTLEDVVRRAHYRNAARTLARLLRLGVVPIVNENDTVATDEIRFGDNDRLAALVAHLAQADALVLLSDVDGLYDGDPRRPGARLLPEVRGPDDLTGVNLGRVGGAGVGTGGMATKVEAAGIATASGVPVLVAGAANVADALGDAETGTLFHPTGARIGSRLRWLAHATHPRGQLHLDAGAVRAVVQDRASLLPAGLIRVTGEFAAGDPVELVDENGRPVARGLVGYDADELPALIGRSTRELAAELGPSYQREVVHRDDIVVLARPAGLASS